MATTTAYKRGRTKLSLAERSDDIADQIAHALSLRPTGLTIRDALLVIAERCIQIRDDLNERNPKMQTWARDTPVRDSSGRVVTYKPLSDDARNKAVASTIGSMLVATYRQTRPWVLDAVDEALGYLPWRVRS